MERIKNVKMKKSVKMVEDSIFPYNHNQPLDQLEERKYWRRKYVLVVELIIKIIKNTATNRHNSCLNFKDIYGYFFNSDFIVWNFILDVPDKAKIPKTR